MKKIICCFLLIVSITASAQTTDSKTWQTLYRATATKINDLVNTKLDVKFDYTKSYMYGKAWITLHPHFYATDSLNLDAKGMNINEVSIVKGGKRSPLKYSYDSSNLRITLDKSYKANENYIVYIDYVSKPNELTARGSAAITDARGLYFINPKGEEKDKPTQIWTQGETEANSAWFPTIDKPNQKTTEEISMTVPAKYVTLSNGLLVSQKKNSDGTRTDTWKMDLPHAPYLFFMGVGDYAIIKDSYKGKEVSYYVEKEYAPVARKIFGLTPEMIAFYSRILGVDFPWQKYAQIVGRDYVSGAMENTTSTLHGEGVQQNARQLVDRNTWESTIAHELFHQWFGDYVTAESWSNITVNESFADYSETLWNEYKYGKDEGQAQNIEDMQRYLSNPADTSKTLVRFYYNDKEDVFDNVSYPKGGAILNMLRNYVGDSAFFKSLHLYLTTNKFKSAEAQNLRLAFEEVTGEDLNWFWNQWYYGTGHPKLNINYDYDPASKTVKVVMRQNQAGRVFKLPFAVDVYEGNNKKRYKVWMQNASDTFAFPANAKPELVNVDADRVILSEKNDSKTLENYMYQYTHAGSFADRREAIIFAANNQSNPVALNFLKTAITDKSPRLREAVITQLDLTNDTIKRAMETTVMRVATTEKIPWVRADAIQALGTYAKPEYKSIFMKATSDSSYSVAGTGLEALGKIDRPAALQQAAILSREPAKGLLANALIRFADESKFDSVATVFEKLGRNKYSILYAFTDFLTQVKTTDKVIKAVDMIVQFREELPVQYRRYINEPLIKLAAAKQTAGQKDQANYIQSKLPKTGQ